MDERERVVAQMVGLSREACFEAFEHYDGEPGGDYDAAADAAVSVVLGRLIDRAKTHGDAGAVELMYALEAEMTQHMDLERDTDG